MSCPIHASRMHLFKNDKISASWPVLYFTVPVFPRYCVGASSASNFCKGESFAPNSGLKRFVVGGNTTDWHINGDLSTQAHYGRC